MRETTLIIWVILGLISGFFFLSLTRRKKRQLGKYVAIYQMVLLLVAFGMGCLIYYLFGETPHLIWISRVSILLLGIIHFWAMYGQTWTVWDKYSWVKDSFLPEFLFTGSQAFIASISFTLAPQVIGLVQYEVDLSLSLWDAPLVFLLPFFALKLGDISSQVPFRMVENAWVYPLESFSINNENWPLRDLMPVIFQVKESLRKEYGFFNSPKHPSLNETPKEVSLGNVFRYIMQDRLKNPKLVNIQDLGDEYIGAPKFCWLFSVKVIWWNPNTWFRKPRYLNPDLSLTDNNLQTGDIILARRIPIDDSIASGISYPNHSDIDSDKTVYV